MSSGCIPIDTGASYTSGTHDAAKSESGHFDLTHSRRKLVVYQWKSMCINDFVAEFYFLNWSHEFFSLEIVEEQASSCV